MIVVEGPDGSGKSTLAQYLGRTLRLPVVLGEGPPRFPGDIDQRLEKYAALPPCICDRHPVISESIYGPILRGGFDFDETYIDRFYDSKPLIIYCDTDNLSRHRSRATIDTPQYLGQLREHHSRIVQGYRHWAIHYANIIYRIGDDKEAIARMVNPFDPVSDIAAFHEKFGLAYQGPPRELEHEMHRLRIMLMCEELCEYVDLPGLTTRLVQSTLIEHKCDHPLENKLDALVDLVYVTLGTAYIHGFDFREAWRRVQTANMTKQRAEKEDDSTRTSTYDVVKPPGFKPADLSDLV